MNVSHPYVRSMKGWWLKHPYYVKYMIRESSAVFVTLYALVLLYGLWSLSKGEAFYNAWLAALNHPLSIAFHVLAMAAASYHAYTWFKVSPKVIPHIYLGTERVSDNLISRVQFVIAGLCYSILFILVVWI